MADFFEKKFNSKKLASFFGKKFNLAFFLFQKS